MARQAAQLKKNRTRYNTQADKDESSNRQNALVQHLPLRSWASRPASSKVYLWRTKAHQQSLSKREYVFTEELHYADAYQYCGTQHQTRRTLPTPNGKGGVR